MQIEIIDFRGSDTCQGVALAIKTKTEAKKPFELYIDGQLIVKNVPKETELTVGMCRLLYALYLREKDGVSEFRFPEDFPILERGVGRGFTTNYNYLWHFGLAENIAKVSQEDRFKGKAVWRLTDKGRDFANGRISVPRTVFGRGKDLWGFGSEHVTILDVLGSEFFEKGVEYRKGEDR